MLPFEDLDDARFNSGKAIKFTDNLRARLSKEKEIGLSLATKEKQGTFDLWKQEEWHDLATHLSVRNLLSGTIRTRQGKRRAVVQLLDGVTGTAIRRWLFEDESEDVIANDVANSVAKMMHARANHEQLPRTTNEIPDVDFVAATTNPDAKNYYIAARELRSRLNVADFDKSIALFEKAIEEDPNYGAAYAMLASACQARSELDPSGPWLEKGNRAAENAIRLAPMLSEAQRASAGTFRYRGQFKQALEAYLSAFELDQTSDRAAATVGNAVADLGRPDLALKWYEKARRRQPRPGLYSEYIGDALSELGQVSGAESAFRNAIIFRPDLPGAMIGLGRLAVFRGDFESARRQCRDAQSRFSDDWELQLFAAEIEFFAHNYEAATPLYQKLIAKRRNGEPDFSGAIRFLSAIGFIYSVTGQPSEGQSLLVEARSYDLRQLEVAPDNPRLLYSLAATEAALKQPNSALEKLQDAVDNGWIDHRSLLRDPRFDAIRDTPRFKEIYLHLRNKMESMDAIMAGRNGGRQ
jgi:tetratricopeptide (TPR) repeat protein